MQMATQLRQDAEPAMQSGLRQETRQCTTEDDVTAGHAWPQIGTPVVSLAVPVEADMPDAVLRNSVASQSATAALESMNGKTAVGERLLLRAVLVDAILCLRGDVGTGRERERLRWDAIRWVRSASRKWPFAFESICDVLGFDVDCLRRRLLRDAARSNEVPQASPHDVVVRAVRSLRRRGNRTTRELGPQAVRHRSRATSAARAR